MNNSKVTELQAQVEEVTDVMKKNIDSVLERGEKIENMHERADKLEKQAKLFKRNAKKLAWHQRLKYYKLQLTVGGVVLLVLAIIFVPMFL